MSPKSFAEALVDALSDPSGVKATKIQSFVNLFNIKQNVVIGAYGNRNSDTKAYLDAGIPRDRIFLVNSNSVLRRVSDGKNWLRKVQTLELPLESLDQMDLWSFFLHVSNQLARNCVP